MLGEGLVVFVFFRGWGFGVVLGAVNKVVVE